MGTNLLLILAVCGVLCLSAMAQQAPPVRDLQDSAGPDEVEFENADEKDREFDDSILSTVGRSSRRDVPTRGEVETKYKEQRERIIAEAEKVSRTEGELAKTELVDVNLYVRFYTRSEWNVVYRCCPRRQNYGCRSVSKPLGCFRHYVNGQIQWCCPFWPNTQVANCNCHKCAILTSTCATTGTCNRRYTLSTIYAVCFGGRPGWTINRIRKHLPTSCYCRAKPGC